jgi:ethanolamine utilization protein EutA (predicted chaperonin)
VGVQGVRDGDDGDFVVVVAGGVVEVVMAVAGNGMMKFALKFNWKFSEG